MPITDTYHAYITLSVIIAANTDKEIPKMLQKKYITVEMLLKTIQTNGQSGA